MARIDFVTGNAREYLPDVEALAAIPDRVEALLAGHTGADVARTPADGDWSGARIIGHMTAYARHLHRRPVPHGVDDRPRPRRVG